LFDSMIIPNDGDKNAASKAALEEQMPQDPPPMYTYVQSTPPLPEPSSSYTPNKVNYVSISRKHGHIKETLTVDPSLYIPESLRAPWPEGESQSSRANVRLESVHGHIEADITLVQDTKAASATHCLPRATLQLFSTHGGIKVTIPDHPRRPPFILTAKSSEGSIRLTLPRSFTGPITISYVHGAVKASALGVHFITLSETNGKMKGFIGDLSKYTERDGEGKGWKGDELVLELKHGDAKLRFEQDRDTRMTTGLEDPSTSSRKSLLAKIFGLS